MYNIASVIATITSADIPKTKLPVIGWTGTHTTAKYLEFLIPVIEKLSFDFDFEFCVISNEEPLSKFKNMNFVKWNKETEIEDLLRFDIGVMPLTDDKWAKGHGLVGERHQNSKLSADLVLTIRSLSETGMTRRAIAKRYGLQAGHVSKIVNRQLWSHI